MKMKFRTRSIIGWALALVSVLLIAARFYLKDIGHSLEADYCTVGAFAMLLVSGWLRRPFKTV